jgi:hypothetical protein
MLTGKDLIALGLKPGPDFAKIIEQCKAFPTREEAEAFARTFIKEVIVKELKPKINWDGSVLEWLTGDGKCLVPPFLEGRQPEPTKSEIRRLLENKAVAINGFRPPMNACLDNQWPIWQLIYFPEGERKTTLADDPKPADANPWYDTDGNLLQE